MGTAYRGVINFLNILKDPLSLPYLELSFANYITQKVSPYAQEIYAIGVVKSGSACTVLSLLVGYPLLLFKRVHDGTNPPYFSARC
jgi:hypothetical protein